MRALLAAAILAMTLAPPTASADPPGIGIPDVQCTHRVNATGTYVFGVPVTTRIEEAHVECHVGETVIVVPDPFRGP